MRQQHTTFALFLILVALVLTAGGARAQQVSTYERAKAGMTVQAARDFDRVIADARARGLPVEPLIDKALEGQAKRVPPERISTVVRVLADQLASARTLLGNSAIAADVVVVADALQRGVSAAAVTRLRAGTPAAEPIGALVRAYADVRARGVPEARADELLAAWQKRKDRNADAGELATAIERLVRQGQAPAQAAAALTARIRAGVSLISAQNLRSDIGAGAFSTGAGGAANGIVRVQPVIDLL